MADDYFKADMYGFLSVYLPRVLTGVFYYGVGLFWAVFNAHSDDNLSSFHI